ncbi:DUF2971 domain-containing protein [Burkholderia gladioli]|uniref:DUF2971 domain-containing protein n=1 Tax=Burkholderia gladioli TaxID=28095 RepID=UPI00163ED692|nr:DUF2971 domain-containing protein [Burkholderia gladioli]
MSDTQEDKVHQAQQNEVFKAVAAKMWESFIRESDFPEVKPTLAHYTSIDTLNSIVTNNEVWLSNPLYMNDVEELRFGISETTRAFYQSSSLRSACESEDRYNELCRAYAYVLKEFEEEHAFDIYITCLSEHTDADDDGRLSMWRGYGGNGKGAAIVFDTSKFHVVENSPLLIAKIHYGSTEERLGWISERVEELASCISSMKVPIDQLYWAVRAFFERMKIFSLFTKHKGFEEEREWRVAYLSYLDAEKKYHRFLGYAVGKTGIEPKLKLKFGQVDGVAESGMSMENIVSKIILGPSVSSPLAVMSVRRMMQHLGRVELSERIHGSTTPYRG